MALTDNQLLMLDILIYSEYCENDKTVGEIIDNIIYALDNPDPNNKDEGINICNMSEEELRSLISKIENQPELLNYTVTNYVNDETTGMRIACFVDDASNPTDINVIFKGSSEDYEWHDNGEGAYLSDTELQVFAAEYIINLPESYGDNLTVSGHSKGGNEAQYVTIVTDRVARCVSFDGQGFSQEFMDKYAEEIAEKAGLIVSISASWDPVNALLYTIAGTTIYIETEMQDSLFYFHKPDILLDEDGNLRPVTEQSAFSIFINLFTTLYISSTDEPYRSYVIDGIVSLFEDGESAEDGWQQLISAFNARSEILAYVEEKYGTEASKELAEIIGISITFFAYDFLNNPDPDLLGVLLLTVPKLVLGGVLVEFILALYLKGKLEEEISVEEISAEEFGKWLVSVITSFSEKYLEDSSTDTSVNSSTNYIRVDTDALRECADRLNKIYNRVVALDSRISTLYRETGWTDLKEIIDDNDLIKYVHRIYSCIEWLNAIADDFEYIEHTLSYQF